MTSTFAPMILLDDKFPVEHMFDRSGLTFVPNVPVRVTSVVGERTYAALTEFFNPFL